MGNKLTFNDIDGKNIFGIFDDNGVKSIHFFGYYYHGDQYELWEPTFMIMPLQEYLDKVAEDECFLDDWYSDIKTYITDMYTEEEVIEDFNHFDNGKAPVFLDELTIDTPYGCYIY